MSLKRKRPEGVQAMPEEPKAVLCFSSVYYNVTDTTYECRVGARIRYNSKIRYKPVKREKSVISIITE